MNNSRIIWIFLTVFGVFVAVLGLLVEYGGSGSSGSGADTYLNAQDPPKPRSPTCKDAAKAFHDKDLAAGFSEDHANRTADSFLQMCLKYHE